MITHQWDTTLLVQTAVTLGEAELGEWCRDGAHGLGCAAMGPCTELTATTRARQLLHLLLESHLILGGLVDHFMQNQVLFSQVGHASLSFLPLILPEVGSECLVLRVQNSLPVAHLHDLADGFSLDFLFDAGQCFCLLDLPVGKLHGFVHGYAALEI